MEDRLLQHKHIAGNYTKNKAPCNLRDRTMVRDGAITYELQPNYI